jgi:hypothetical protein
VSGGSIGAGGNDPSNGGATAGAVSLGGTSGAESGGEGGDGDSGNAGAGARAGTSGVSGMSTGGSGGQEGMTGNPLFIKASNPDAADYFGDVVALEGAWLAVGASNEASRATGIDGDQSDDSEDGSGAVYLYSDDGSGWAQRAYIKASNAEGVDSFGDAVALSGDRLAVGAPHEDSPATGIDGDQGNGSANSGAVYVFVREDDVWRQEAYVKASNTGMVDVFGASVDLEGDTLVVGAPAEDSGAITVGGDELDDSVENSGAVYVFERGNDGWLQTAYVKGSYSEARDAFGQAVSMSGDTLAIGAPWESSSATGVDPEPADNAANNSGAVYVFERDGATFRQAAFLKASNTDADDEFGSHLALDGDTLAVSAALEGTRGGDGTTSNELAPESGAVYVFERSAGVWAQTAYLKPTDPANGYYFGLGLALLGDTLVVGSMGDSQYTRTGAIYVYRRSASGFRLEERREAPGGGEVGDRYGSAVAITPTLLAVGAYTESSDSPGINGDATNNRAADSGAVFLYRR